MEFSTGYVMFGLAMYQVHLAQFALNRVLFVCRYAVFVLPIKTAHYVFFSDHVLCTSVMRVMQVVAVQ